MLCDSLSLSWTTLPRLVCTDITCSRTEQPWDLLWCHYWFRCEMGSEKWLQKFHTNDVSLPRSELLVLMIQWSKVPLQNSYQKHYPDLASDASSVWNFCRRPRCHFAGNGGGITKSWLFSQASPLAIYDVQDLGSITSGCSGKWAQQKSTLSKTAQILLAPSITHKTIKSRG